MIKVGSAVEADFPPSPTAVEAADPFVEIERLRKALRGIASCSTCDACRGAALMVLGENDERRHEDF